MIITETIGNGWGFENEWKHDLKDVCLDQKLCCCAFVCPFCFQCECKNKNKNDFYTIFFYY